MKQPDAGVIRITDSQGETLGTGFLVSDDGRVATCFHVVEGVEPCVAFPGGEPRPAQVVTTDETHDVAVLRVEGELPPGAAPARLGRSAGAHYRDFRSRGYRPLGGLEGIPAEGRVLDAVSECPGYPDVRHKPLVLQTQHVRGGMSGAPVYVPDLDLVVGMITAHWDSLKAKTGFSDRDTALVTPAEAIVALCPDIRLWEPPPDFLRPPLGVPFQAPPVPRYFVPRLEVSQELKARLLAEEVTAPGALVVSAVHGLGGIGKTTLVAALAHDPDVQARFPDGVLWATLGQQPEALPRLHEWVQALGDYDFHPTTVDGASAHLRTLLHDEVCLLVIDDGWHADHVRPFLVGGSRCRVLVTTRDATLARKVGARLYDLDVMTEAQALALFEARLGPLNGHRDQAAALACELGYLPLALELAAAQVEAASSWAELLDAFRGELVDLRALDLGEATYRNESLRLSFRLSLEQLTAEDQEAFAWLGVLPEGARLNPAMAATPWDQPQADARKRLRRLRDRALLKPVGGERYTIHDLLHDEAKLRLAERMPLPEAHVALLTRYQRKAPDRQWHRLPDDGYIHERLTWHMEQAGWADELHTLLREETALGQNGWYEARRRLRQTAGYLEDVQRAWQLADKQCASYEPPFTIDVQCRCALITASVHSLASTVPPKLLVALMTAGQWDLVQTLDHVQLVSDPRRQSDMLVVLAPYLSEGLTPRAFAIARELLDPPRGGGMGNLHCSDALIGLAPYLSHLLLCQAVEAVRAVRDEYVRDAALVGIAPYLPEPLLREALSIAQATPRPIGRVFAIASYLPEPERTQALQRELRTVRAMRRGWDRASALAKFAPYLTERLMNDAVDAAQTHWSGYWRARPLIELAPHLPEGLRDEAVRRVLLEVQSADKKDHQIWGRGQADLFVRLAPYLPESLLQEAIETVQAIRDEHYQAQALAELIPQLQGPLLDHVTNLAQDIKGRDARAQTLAELTCRWAELGCTNAARALAQTIERGEWRAEALAGLASNLAEPERTLILREAMDVARAVLDEKWLMKSLVCLVSHLPEPERSNSVQEILGAAQMIQPEDDRAQALTWLVHHLPERAREGALQDALMAARLIDCERVRTGVLIELIPSLSEPERVQVTQEALLVAKGIVDDYERAQAMIALIPYLGEPQCTQSVHEALKIVPEIADAHEQAELLTELIPHLPQTSIAQAVELARAIGRPGERVWALSELATRLPGQERAKVLHEELDWARKLEFDFDHVRALSKLALHLSEKECKQVLQEAVGIALKARHKPYAHWWAPLLSSLVPHLPNPQRRRVLQKVLDAAQAVEDGHLQGQMRGVLSRIAHYLSRQMLEQALEIARNIEYKHVQASELTGLVPYLPEPDRTHTLHEALSAALMIGDYVTLREEVLATLSVHLVVLPPATLYGFWCDAIHILAHRTRADLLSDLCALAPVIYRLGGEEAIAEAVRAIQDVGRWWP